MAARRDPFLTVMAALFGLLAVSNFTKALQHHGDPAKLGVVVFGIRAETTGANIVLGAALGAVLAAYAWGLWTRRRWVRPLAYAYAFWVPLNLVLFWYRQTGPDVPAVGGLLAYLAVALGGSIGTALYVASHRDALG